MPTRDTAWAAGTPCWVDYAADDLTAAQSFYSSLLGWTFTEGREEFGGYTNAMVGDKLVAGMAPKMSGEQPTMWTTYLATDDAEATAAAIDAAGGTVVAGPMQVGSLGAMIVAIDDQGVPFGAWQAKEHNGFQWFNETGGVVWNEGLLPDSEAGRAFFGAVFGMSFVAMDDSSGYSMMSVDDNVTGGIGPKEDDVPLGWRTYFAVDSISAAVERATEAGAKVVTPIASMPWGQMAALTDPWGVIFALAEISAG